MLELRSALLCGLAVFASHPAAADPISDFYSGPGKQMRIVVRTTVGGDYDILSRIIARHLGKHIPGHPNFTVVNMPAAGGIAAANYMAQVAPKDGTVLSIIGQGLPVDQALGPVAAVHLGPARVQLDRQCGVVELGAGDLAHLADQDAG